MRVLYVEDAPEDADLARLRLGRSAPDLELTVAGSLAAGREQLENGTFDALLCDLRLPDGNGLELLAWVRERRLPLTVVMVTGSGDQRSALAALKGGADDYLVKRDDYLDRVADTLRAAHRRFQEASRSSRPLQVLYVEHDPFDLEITQRHFAEHAPHMRLDPVSDAETALARLPGEAQRANPYDLLLMDYRLPGMDALELAKIVRHERRLETPMVLVSGQGSEETVALAMRVGISEYVAKHPDYLPELVAVMEKCYHRAAQARASAELRHLLEASPVILYRLRLEGDQPVPLWVSDNIRRLLGYTPEEAREPGWWRRVLDSPYREELPTLDPALWRRGRALRVYRIRDRDGRPRWIRDEQRLVRDSADAPWELAGTWSDITEQRRVQERLELDDTIFNATRDGVYVTDAEGTILRVNRALTEITGYDAEQLIGRNPRMLQSGRHEAAFYRQMWDTLLRTGHWEGEVWNRRRNSEVYPHRLTIRAVHDEHGNVQNYVGVSTDITQTRRYQDQAEHLTHHDPLTQLPNRRLLGYRLEYAVEQARRHNQSLALLVLDLDRFRSINDSLGHSAGDELLCRVAERLAARLGDLGTVARPSSDEFALLLENLESHQQAADTAGALLEVLDAPVSLTAEREVFPRASVGIAVFPEDGDSAEDILRDAHAALRSAKAAGGGSYRFYTAEMNAEAMRAVELETALRRAEQRRELVLHYQPKLCLRSGQLCGAEALLRWRRDDGSLTPPGEFIPLAERTGLIVSLGAWAIDEACRQLRAWQDAGMPELELAVNVSARQFQDPGLEAAITGALERHAIDPGRLALELTESMLMDDPESAVQRLRRLKALGVKLALDDFGTGYSSLAYLRQFPIDCLKIDRSFVNGMVQDPGAATIAMSIIALAHRMQLTVVAEGVETEAQLELLRRHGCDQVQGYLVSPAVPPAEFAALAREGHALPGAGSESGPSAEPRA